MLNETLQWICIGVAIATTAVPAVTRVVRDFKEEETDDDQ